jgi:hypothetical protein
MVVQGCVFPTVIVLDGLHRRQRAHANQTRVWCHEVKGCGELQAKAMPNMLVVLSMTAPVDVVTSLEMS